MQTEHLSFRASTALAGALSERAAKAGCSVSEYLRSIVQEKVGPVTGREVFLAAANGDADALGMIRDQTYGAACRVTGTYRAVLLAESLAFSRLASALGSRRDLQNTVYICGELAAQFRDLGDTSAATGYEAQGLLLSEMMAEEGDEETAAMVLRAAPSVEPETLIEAIRLRDLIDTQGI